MGAMIKDNISKYSNYKEVDNLISKNNKEEIKFLTNDEDEWFVEVIKFYKKSGKIISKETIIAKDIPTMKLHYIHEDF